MREEDEVHVNNIISCINEIEGYVEGMTYEQFSIDEEVRQSADANLEQIGAAASLLSDDFVSEFTDVDFRVLESLKTAKFNASIERDYRQVWVIIKEDLPDFRDMLSTISEQMDFRSDEDDLSDNDSISDENEYSRKGKSRGRSQDDADDFFDTQR